MATELASARAPRAGRLALVLALLVAMLATAVPADARHARQVDRAPVLTLDDGTRVGSSKLVRSHGRIRADLRTRGLPRGHAVTVWAVVFNRPGACDGPCDAADLADPAVDGYSVLFDGAVVRRHWTRFRARVPAEAVTRPRRAEVHLVIRTHGPVIPGLADEMTSTLNGGCPPNVCANIRAAIHTA